MITRRVGSAVLAGHGLVHLMGVALLCHHQPAQTA